MITREEYVTHAQGKALRTLMFDWPCWTTYSANGQFEKHSYHTYNKQFWARDWCTAPTQPVACRWLREEKGLSVDAYIQCDGYTWQILKCGNPKRNARYVDSFDETNPLFPTYEAALSAGIDRALELLTSTKK